MAAEIRDLEDQLYQYDHEYRLLEQETESLRQQNANLRQNGNSSASTDPLELYNPSRRSSPVPVRPDPPLSADDTGPSVLESGDPSTAEELDPQPAAPSLPFRNGVLPSPNSASDDASADQAGEFPLDGLVPPTIEAGEPMPPLLPAGDDQTAAGGLELNQSRIEVPARLASQRIPAATATITPAREQVTDKRVVELAFHPSLSRAANFDDQTDDDGLYLVLQPKNQQGQMVPSSADLTVVVLDPAREGDAARIGRWDYSAAEVKDKLQPIGSNQGIHLTLPWNGPDPSADRVLVFVRYTFTDGRQVIGEKTFFVSGDNGMQTVWTPRSTSGDQRRSPVVSASHVSQTPQRDTSRVIRPAAGSFQSDPAPAPR